MKKFLKTSLFILIFLAGLSLLLYPYVANEWNSYRQSQLITTYDAVVQEKAEGIDYIAEWERARAYNNSLIPLILPDSFS